VNEIDSGDGRICTNRRRGILNKFRDQNFSVGVALNLNQKMESGRMIEDTHLSSVWFERELLRFDQQRADGGNSIGSVMLVKKSFNKLHSMATVSNLNRANSSAFSVMKGNSVAKIALCISNAC
jgi:hypothetical protein